jgi:hypothetical protein
MVIESRGRREKEKEEDGRRSGGGGGKEGGQGEAIKEAIGEDGLFLT